MGRLNYKATGVKAVLQKLLTFVVTIRAKVLGLKTF